MSKISHQIVCFFMIVCFVLGVSSEISFSQDPKRGLLLESATDSISIPDQQGEPMRLYEESHALIIGISNYTNGWPSLPGVKKDVEEVKAILEEQGFNVVVTMDLDHIELDQVFDDFINQYGHGPENRLLFYFAGHGHTVKTTYGEELGYIVPSNAPNPHKALPEFQSTAMEMQQIEIYAKRIQSKHALFLFDACFAGSLFALSRAVPEIISYKTASPVRQFITSGSADETVPDESIFRAQFVRALQGEADSDQDGYVTGSELGEFLQASVVNYSRNAQHPQYGKIRNPHLDKGDFVLKLRDPQTVEPPPAPDIPAPITSAFDDIEAQLKWQDYLNTMEEAYLKIRRYEELDVEAESKIAVWERFINTFTEDNPYSDRDEELHSLAKERLAFWQEQGPAAQIPEPQKSIFRIRGIDIKDANGERIQAEDEIYSVKIGETITIIVDVESSSDHTIEATWTTRNGEIPSGTEMTNTYTARKPGPDYVIIYLWNEDTGDELEEPISLNIVP